MAEDEKFSRPGEGAQAPSPKRKACLLYTSSALDLGYSKRDLDASYDASSATVITLSGDSASVQGAGAQASAAGAVISSAGTYIVSGELTDGQLLVCLLYTSRCV